jgi:hypothetical protein
VNSYLPIVLNELESFRRLLLKLLIPVFAIVAVYVAWAKTPGHFVREVGKTRLALAHYYQNNGHFPNSIAEMDPKLVGGEDEISHEVQSEPLALWWRTRSVRSVEIYVSQNGDQIRF